MNQSAANTIYMVSTDAGFSWELMHPVKVRELADMHHVLIVLGTWKWGHERNWGSHAIVPIPISTAEQNMLVKEGRTSRSIIAHALYLLIKMYLERAKHDLQHVRYDDLTQSLSKIRHLSAVLERGSR